MASYCAVVRRYSTSKHGIVISQYQNALVRVNPKTLLLQIVWLLISNLKGKEGWVLGTSLTSGRLVQQMPCLLVAYPHTVAILYLIDCLNECVLRR